MITSAPSFEAAPVGQHRKQPSVVAEVPPASGKYFGTVKGCAPAFILGGLV